jgi:uncharacterized membrane protein YhaH (DUF805 family)
LADIQLVGTLFCCENLKCESYIRSPRFAGEHRKNESGGSGKMDIVQMYFSFRGRISRKPYWIAILPLIIGYAVADVMTESADESIEGLGYLAMIILLWPSLAVQTKRWHDRDKSGWWNLIGAVPIIGPFWAFIELGFLRGTSGANRYDLLPGTRPSYGQAAPISRAKNPYLADPLIGSPTVTEGTPVRNSWRGQ